jgi:hypothetical protein
VARQRWLRSHLHGADEEGCDHVRTVCAAVGFDAESGWLRVELLATIKQQALAGYEKKKASRTPTIEQSAV